MLGRVLLPRNSLLRGTRNISVNYTLAIASKDMRGIMAGLFMPMTQCPSFKSAMRLHLSAASEKAVGNGMIGSQYKVWYCHDDIYAEHATGVEKVQSGL